MRYLISVETRSNVGANGHESESARVSREMTSPVEDISGEGRVAITRVENEVNK